MIFSTADFTNKESDRTFYPEAWKRDFPVERVSKGLNFFADLALNDELDGPLIGRLKRSTAMALDIRLSSILARLVPLSRLPRKGKAASTSNR